MPVDRCEDNVVSESPILFSTTEEMGKFIMDELRVKLLDLIEEGLLINAEETKDIWLPRELIAMLATSSWHGNTTTCRCLDNFR